MVRLDRISNAEKVNICKKYFFFGLGLLPFLWAINSVWFFKEAFVKPAYPEQRIVKKYVLLSTFGALVWLLLFVGWIIVYQTQRAAWGEVGDAISFIIPPGIP